MSVDIPFTNSDAWLLLAIDISHSGEASRLAQGVSLHDVIASGDTIGHTIFTLQELRRGIAKLTLAGLVVFDGQRLFLTERGRSLLARIGHARPALERWTRLSDLLGATQDATDQPDYDDPAFPFPALTPAMVSEAVSRYLAHFRAHARDYGGRDRRS